MMSDNPFDLDYVEREPEPAVEREAPRPKSSHITVYKDIDQGSEAWLQLRCGKLTASEMKYIITEKTLKPASNDKEKAHLWELLSQRITNYVEPKYISDDMLRGNVDEIEATILYEKHYAPIEPISFMTNDKFGFTIGYSPDGKIAGKNAGIENKSRRQRFQIETIANLAMPVDYAIQVQTGLAVSEWDWIDFNSYSGGLHMITITVHPDPVVQNAIVEAAGAFEQRLSAKLDEYNASMATYARLIPTERRIEQEMYI